MKPFLDSSAIWVSIGFKLFPRWDSVLSRHPYLRTGPVLRMAAQILGIVMMCHSALSYGLSRQLQTLVPHQG